MTIYNDIEEKYGPDPHDYCEFNCGPRCPIEALPKFQGASICCAKLGHVYRADIEWEAGDRSVGINDGYVKSNELIVCPECGDDDYYILAPYWASNLPYDWSRNKKK